MSQENVDVVRAFFEAWNAGNTDAVVELLDADVDYFPSRKLPEARPCHGPEEVLQFIARYLDAYSRHDWATQEVIDVGGDRFLARVNLRVEGRDSGVKLEGDLYHCLWLLAVYGHGDVGALEEVDRAFNANVRPLRAVNSDATQMQGTA